MAFYVGGRVSGLHIETHDVQFHVGQSYQEILPRIQKSWPGPAKSMHIDSWIVLDCWDGYRIELNQKENGSSLKLFLVNVGFYKKNHFGEYHEFCFEIAKDSNQAKIQALEKLRGTNIEVHKDDLFDIDDCIEVNLVENYRISILPDPKAKGREIKNGWQRIPKDY